MKTKSLYPIRLFEEPIAIPKELERDKELLSEIEGLMDKHKTSRKVKSRAFKLFVAYLSISFKFNINATLQFCILRQDKVLVEFVIKDKESKFVEQLMKYNQIFREKGRSKFQYLYVKAMRNGENLLLENEVVEMFYHDLSKIPNFKEEITKESDYKITYQIENKSN